MDRKKALGIKLPFNNRGIFEKVFDSNEQLKYNFINLILTTKG